MKLLFRKTSTPQVSPEATRAIEDAERQLQAALRQHEHGEQVVRDVRASLEENGWGGRMKAAWTPIILKEHGINV